MQKNTPQSTNQVPLIEHGFEKESIKKQKNRDAFKKHYAKIKGTLEQTLLEKAKTTLMAPHFDAEAVILQNEFKTLTDEEKKKLRATAVEKRKYLKKHPEKIQKIQSNMAEEKKVGGQPFGGKIPTPVQKLQAYIEKYTDKLDSADGYGERLDLMRKWNNKEHLSLIHHFSQLKMVPGNFQDLLKALCEVINDDQNLEQKLRLFLCVCSLYKKPVDLPISPQLYIHMLSYLIEQPAIKSEQATGFLKAVFCNGISLVGSNIKSMREFDLKFGGHIGPFYTKLQTSLNFNERPFLVLPQTCFFLSKPVINLLKSHTEPTAFLPIEYYHYFLSILVYTFTDEQTHVDQLLDMLKDHLRHWERIKNSNYSNFLSDTLSLATQKKIQDFTPELVNEIIADEMVVQDLFQRVSALEQSNQSEHQVLLESAMEFNQFNKKAINLFSAVSMESSFDKYYLFVFTEWGLSALNPQQLMLCKLFEREKFLIANPGLGMGKSTFIAFQAIHKACNTKGCVIVVLNSNGVLLFRDYSKVNFIVQQLQQKHNGFNFFVELIDAPLEVKQRSQSQILFMSPSTFLQCKFGTQFVVFNDECHRDLLASNSAPLIEKLKTSDGLFATTGTSLSKEQLKFLQYKFNGTAVRFKDIYRHNCEHIVLHISTTAVTHINALLKLIKQECFKAPVTVITNEQLKNHLLEKTKTVGKSAVIPLFGDNITDIEASEVIQADFNRQNEAGAWNCYLINEQQGTGIDFPSHPDIEMNGGVRVIIAVEPASYAELCQYQRRTARLNNKGKVFYLVNRFQTSFRGATKDYLTSITRRLKAVADIDTKKILREINTALNEEDEIMSEEESEAEVQEVQLDNAGDEEEKEGNLYVDRDMCQQCFGEIYLNAPVHVCGANMTTEQECQQTKIDENVQVKEMPTVGKKTARRVTPIEAEVNQNKTTPKYTNPLLQDLAEKPKAKKFEANEQNNLGFQVFGKRATRKIATEKVEQQWKKRQRVVE